MPVVSMRLVATDSHAPDTMFVAICRMHVVPELPPISHQQQQAAAASTDLSGGSQIPRQDGGAWLVFLPPVT
jgi:hypothetical protein